MNQKLFLQTILILFFISTLTSAQLLNSKVKNNSALTAGSQNKSLNISLKNTFSKVGKNIQTFLSKANVNQKKNQGIPVNLLRGVSNKIANTKLLLPSADQLKNNSVGKVIWNQQSGTPRLVEIKSGRLAKTTGASSADEQEKAVKNFITVNKGIFKISNPDNELSLKSYAKDELGYSHFKFTQRFNGIELWGKEIVAHLDNSGNITYVNGSFESTPGIQNTDGTLDSDGAISQTIYEIRKSRDVVELSPSLKKLLNYTGPSAAKIIWYDKNHKPHLAWHVEVRSGLSEDWYYFIDANTSEVLNYYNNVCYDGIKTATATDLNGISRQIGTYQAGSKYYMMDASKSMFNAAKSVFPSDPVGVIAALDVKNQDFTSNASIDYVSSTNNQWNDPAPVSANNNAAQTYDYYSNVHKRNSIDDKGMTIYSIVHVTKDGESMENAFWTGKVMCYGDGGAAFKPLAGALDIAAHEMTHGITEYSAGLEYQNQSGALNESISDVFGVLVDSLDWNIGEDVMLDVTNFPTGALRSLADPHNGGTNYSWQPKYMNEFIYSSNTESGDWGGVHINCGIPNFAFYLTATNIGRFKAGKIWYRALTAYLTRQSDFADARIATEKAAADLFGQSSTEAGIVKNSWDIVQVSETSTTPDNPTYDLTGDDWILVTNSDVTDYNSLYMAKSVIYNEATDLMPISQTEISNRPAVTDASGIILFIDSENNLRILFADPNDPQEESITEDNYWWSVAAGPGLNSIAMTSIEEDTSIYYFDLNTGISKQYKIIIKSYDGIEVKTALYADALSFDPSGRYIIFDCYNEFQKSDGSKVKYWTINLLDLETGNIVNVFPPQSEGINIGNPAFSKTSQNRFTFDYINNNTNEVHILAADFDSGDVGIVAGPSSVLGFPTYSGNDKMIAYHTTEYSNGSEVDAINKMPLMDDLITGTGDYSNYLYGATYPFWFVIGTRVDVQEKEEIPAGYSLYQNYPNPFNPETNIVYQIPEAGYVTLKLYDVLGREISTIVNEYKNAGTYKVMFNGQASLNNRRLTSGIYFYKIQTGNYSETKKMILLK